MSLEPTAQSKVTLALKGRNADVWAWHERIEIECEGCSGCKDVHLRVNNANVPLIASKEGAYADVALREGLNRIVAVCVNARGDERLSNSLVYTVRLQDRPAARIGESRKGNRIVLDGSRSEPSKSSHAPIVKYSWSLPRDGDKEPRRLSGKRIALDSPKRDGEYYTSLSVTDKSGKMDTSTTYFVVQGGVPRVPDFDTENPAWVERAIVYGVIPFLFGDKPLQSVTAKLEYLRQLGINAIWLSPINVSPPGDYGYAVTDYFDIRPDYGTKADFHELVRTAHAKGIRVLMDFASNDTSDQHPYFKDAQANGTASHYYNFYDRDKNGQPTHYFDWTNLPNLNYENPEVERFMIEAFSYWVREFDVDGFRVDAAWAVRERSPKFWPRWRRELKRIKPDLFLLAEGGARDPYYFSHGFDAAYDWTDNVGQWSWDGTFNHEATLGYALGIALTNGDTGYDSDALVFRFLNNNDTGIRFVDAYSVDMTRVAAAMLLTLPGVPCIYTGDEVGAQYLPYETTSPIEWNDRHGLREYYRKLIKLRLETPSLHSRNWTLLRSHPGGQTLSYLRHTGEFGEPVLVVLNYGPRTSAEFTLPKSFGAFPRGGVLMDKLAGERLKVPDSRNLKIPMNAWTARVLAPEERG